MVFISQLCSLSRRRPYPVVRLCVRQNMTRTKHQATPSVSKNWAMIKAQLLNKAHSPVGSISRPQWNQLVEALHNLKAPLGKNLYAALVEAFALLDRMHEEVTEKKSAMPRLPLPLPTVLLHLTIDSWRRQAAEFATKGKVFPISAKSLLQKVEHFTETGLFDPSAKTYGMLVEGMASTEDKHNAPILAEELLERMTKQYGQDPAGRKLECAPNTVIVNSIINLWIKSGRSDSMDAIERKFQKLKDWYRFSGRDDQKPNAYTYSSLISALGRCGHHQAVERAETLLREYEASTGKQPCTVLYTSFCQTLATTNAPGAADRAQAVLNEMLFRSRHGEDMARPNSYTILAVVSTYLKEGRIDEAEVLVRNMEDLSRQRADDGLRPGVFCYNSLIHACAKNGNAEHAESILNHLLDSAESGNSILQPNIVTWNNVLHAWAKSKHPARAQRASNVFERMQLLDRAGITGASADNRTLNILIDCYVNSPNPNAFVHQSIELFESVKSQDVDSSSGIFDPVSYRGMMDLLCKAGEFDRALRLHKRYIEKSTAPEAPLQPDRAYFNVLMSGLARSGWEKAVESVEAMLTEMHSLAELGYNTHPDVVSYNSLLNCFATSSQVNAPSKAFSALRRMEQLWANGDLSAVPDASSYSAVCATWANAGLAEGAEKAEKVLRHMLLHRDQTIQSTSQVFNTVMVAYARQGDAPKVQKLFDEWLETDNTYDSRIYVTLLQAWSKAGNPESTASVLYELIRLFDSAAIRNPPTTQMFNAVLQAWLRSGRKHAEVQIKAGVDEMSSLATSGRFPCAPDALTYSTLFSACVRSGRDDLGELAHNGLLELKSRFVTTRNPMYRPDLRIFAEAIMLVAMDDKYSTKDILSQLLLELNAVNGTIWKKQGQIAMNRILAAISRSTINEKEVLAQLGVEIMRAQNVSPDESTRKFLARCCNKEGQQA
jgi:pentatricopeptide repeat protein